MHFPKIEIINDEFGIGACNLEDIPEHLEKKLPREQIAALYWHERDWLVLNKGNLHYDYYKNFFDRLFANG